MDDLVDRTGAAKKPLSPLFAQQQCARFRSLEASAREIAVRSEIRAISRSGEVPGSQLASDHSRIIAAYGRIDTKHQALRGPAELLGMDLSAKRLRTTTSVAFVPSSVGCEQLDGLHHVTPHVERVARRRERPNAIIL